MSSEPLQVAYRLIREGNKQEAVRILTPIVRADPQNADAWWLLANAVDNPEQKRRALERVLRLRPEDERAQRMYANLQNPAPQARRAPPPSPAVESFPATDEFSTRDAEFTLDDSVDPFGSKPKRVEVRRRRGASPCGIILAIIGLVVVLTCGLCVVGLTIGAPVVGRVFGEVLQTVTYMPEFGTIESALTQLPGFSSMMETAAAAAGTAIPSSGNFTFGTPAASEVRTLPTDLQKRGTISIGQTVNNTVDDFVDDSWTFSGDAGATVTIELNAVDNAFDPQLSLYDPSGVLIAENDDIDGSSNRNSRIEIALPASGRYTIRVGAFGSGGDYMLTLS